MMNPDETSSLCYELSLAIAWSIAAVPNQCYANAWHTLDALAAWADLRLIEGWMVLEQATEITVVEHAWCARDSLLIDPSLVLLLPKTACLAAHFFPGVSRQRADLRALAACDLPLVRSCGHYGPDGFGHPDYQAAYRGACDLGSRLAETGKPLVVQASVMPGEDAQARALVVRIVSSHNFRTSGNGARDA